MGAKSTHISVHFRFISVCLRASRRAVPREKPRLQGAVRSGGVSELLQSFYLQMGTWLWFAPVRCCPRQPSEPAQQCARHHILFSADGPWTVCIQKSCTVFSVFLLGVSCWFHLPCINSGLCSGGFLHGLRVNICCKLCIAVHQCEAKDSN